MPPAVVRAANDENTMSPRASSPSKQALPAQQPVPTTSAAPARRVLGDVSANARVNSPVVGLVGSKPMTGSPLKRSFTAAIEEGQGFTYLKKRKLSGEQALSQLDGPVEREGRKMDKRAPEQGTIQQSAPSLELDLPSPTEPNTPSDSGEDTQDSADRKSFSSLINYDPSSQQTAGASQQYTQQHHTSSLVFQCVSHAEMLKLRLRVAMYKVKTNQINTPFAQLRVAEASSSASPRATSSDAVEEAVASLRREAQLRMPPLGPQSQAYLQPNPQLLPAPVLLPTAYSSRMIYDRPLPSSPPLGSPLKSGQHTQVSTPLSSAGRLARADSADLTSSVVKGRVADSLLGLRHAV